MSKSTHSINKNEDNVINSNKVSTNNIKLFTIFVTLFISSNVLAGDEDPIGDGVCLMIGIFQYNVTRIISIIAIMGLGFLAFKGKLSWIISLIIITGIIIVYKASSIVGMIYGEDLSQYCSAAAWSGYGSNDIIGHALCRVLKVFRSNTMRALAVVGIIVLGMQALGGSLKWTMALMSIVGVILMLAAPNIIISITGNDYNVNCYGKSDNDRP